MLRCVEPSIATTSTGRFRGCARPTPPGKYGTSSQRRGPAEDALSLETVLPDEASKRQGDSPRSAGFKAQWEALVGRVRALLIESEQCKLCGVKMGTEFAPVEKEVADRNIRPSVMTFDRINPGCRGGRYDPGNVQLLCWGCNCMKYTYTQDQARKLVRKLYRAEWTYDHEDRLLEDDGDVERILPNDETKEAIAAQVSQPSTASRRDARGPRRVREGRTSTAPSGAKIFAASCPTA
ncbi:unnamed protein product [Parajaminaea phylloscopi]